MPTSTLTSAVMATPRDPSRYNKKKHEKRKRRERKSMDVAVREIENRKIEIINDVTVF